MKTALNKTYDIDACSECDGVYFNNKSGYEPSLADLCLELESRKRLEDMFLLRGLVYIANGKSFQAVNDLDCALALNPNCSDAHYFRGCAYFLMGIFDQSIMCFQSVKKLTPYYSGVDGAHIMAVLLIRFYSSNMSIYKYRAFLDCYSEQVRNRIVEAFKRKRYQYINELM